MYVDRGRTLYGLWIHFVLLVCLFVSLPVRLSVRLPVFCRLSVCLLDCLFIFHLAVFVFLPYLSHFYSFCVLSVQFLRPPVFLPVP